MDLQGELKIAKIEIQRLRQQLMLIGGTDSPQKAAAQDNEPTQAKAADS